MRALPPYIFHLLTRNACFMYEYIQKNTKNTYSNVFRGLLCFPVSGTTYHIRMMHGMKQLEEGYPV